MGPVRRRLAAWSGLAGPAARPAPRGRATVSPSGGGRRAISGRHGIAPHCKAYTQAMMDGALRGDTARGLAVLDAALRTAPVESLPLTRDQSMFVALGVLAPGSAGQGAARSWRRHEARLDAASPAGRVGVPGAGARADRARRGEDRQRPGLVPPRRRRGRRTADQEVHRLHAAAARSGVRPCRPGRLGAHLPRAVRRHGGRGSDANRSVLPGAGAVPPGRAVRRYQAMRGAPRSTMAASWTFGRTPTRSFSRAWPRPGSGWRSWSERRGDVRPENCLASITERGRFAEILVPSSVPGKAWRNLMRYVDGFLLAVPKRKLPTYRRIAQRAGRLWREHGALEYRECTGDDLKVKFGLSLHARRN